MGSDWIPIQVDLPRRREVLVVAEEAGLSRHEVVGLLVELWSWATRETRTGKLQGVTMAQLEAGVGGDKTFWDSIIRAGWLALEEDGFRIPRWNRWLSKTAKARIRDTFRKRAARADARTKGGQKADTNGTRPRPTSRSRGGKKAEAERRKRRSAIQALLAHRGEIGTADGNQEWMPTDDSLHIAGRGPIPWRRLRLEDLLPALDSSVSWSPILNAAPWHEGRSAGAQAGGKEPMERT